MLVPGAVFAQQLHHFKPANPARVGGHSIKIQRRLALAIANVHVRPAGDEQLSQVRLAGQVVGERSLDQPMQRRSALVVLSIGIGLMIEEQFDVVLAAGDQTERSVAGRIANLHVGAIGQQHLPKNFRLQIHRQEMQWRIAIPAPGVGISLVSQQGCDDAVTVVDFGIGVGRRQGRLVLRAGDGIPVAQIRVGAVVEEELDHLQMAIGHGEIQRRLALAFALEAHADVDLRLGSKELPGDFHVVDGCRDVERRFAKRIGHTHIRGVSHEQFRHRLVAARHGHVQRGAIATAILPGGSAAGRKPDRLYRIHASAVVQECFRDALEPFLSREMKRGAAGGSGGGVDIGLVRDQQLGDGLVTLACGQMQRGIAVRISRIHVGPVGEQQFGHGFAAAGNRIVQGGHVPVFPRVHGGFVG